MDVYIDKSKAEELSEAEKLDKIEKVINSYENKEEALIQILHESQQIYGFLPMEIQKFISKKTNIPISKIYGVISFYSFFSTKPRGKYTIRVCLGTACYVRGGKKIVDKLKSIFDIEVGDTTADGKFTLEVMRCIGACGLAPAITINDVVYKQVNPDKLNTIIEKYY